MPDLEFIADMNISPLTVDELRKKGWDIVRVSEIMSVKTKDIEILIFAKKNNKVLISQYLDFSMLLAVGGYQKPSVINLRLNNATPNPDKLEITNYKPQIIYNVRLPVGRQE